MTAAAASRPSGRRGDRCLDCAWCRSDTEFVTGADYICIRFGKPLSKRKLWGPPCAQFKPLRDEPIDEAGGTDGRECLH